MEREGRGSGGRKLEWILKGGKKRGRERGREGEGGGSGGRERKKHTYKQREGAITPGHCGLLLWSLLMWTIKAYLPLSVQTHIICAKFQSCS